MGKKYGIGCNKSKLDGSEYIYDKAIGVPDIFSITKIMPPVTDQGNTFKCVAHSTVACMDFFKNSRENDNNGLQYNIDDLYNKRNNPKQDGMEIKNALSILLHEGLRNNFNKYDKIKGYAKVNSDLHLKTALMLNGPVLAALPVRSYNTDFWNGPSIIGYHCVVITGYNKEGFEIRNSWGSGWGKKGYTLISYKDFDDNIIEMWTIFK